MLKQLALVGMFLAIAPSFAADKITELEIITAVEAHQSMLLKQMTEDNGTRQEVAEIIRTLKQEPNADGKVPTPRELVAAIHRTTKLYKDKRVKDVRPMSFWIGKLENHTDAEVKKWAKLHRVGWVAGTKFVEQPSKVEIPLGQLKVMTVDDMGMPVIDKKTKQQAFTMQDAADPVSILRSGIVDTTSMQSLVDQLRATRGSVMLCSADQGKIQGEIDSVVALIEKDTADLAALKAEHEKTEKALQLDIDTSNDSSMTKETAAKKAIFDAVKERLEITASKPKNAAGEEVDFSINKDMMVKDINAGVQELVTLFLQKESFESVDDLRTKLNSSIESYSNVLKTSAEDQAQTPGTLSVKLKGDEAVAAEELRTVATEQNKVLAEVKTERMENETRIQNLKTLQTETHAPAQKVFSDRIAKLEMDKSKLGTCLVSRKSGDDLIHALPAVPKTKSESLVDSISLDDLKAAKTHFDNAGSEFKAVRPAAVK